MAGVKVSLILVVLLLLGKSMGDAEFDEDAQFGQSDNSISDAQLGKEKDLEDDQFFGTDEELNNVEYANDAQEGSGEDDDNIFIPVEPKKKILPKTRPKDPEPDVITQSVDLPIEQTSFKPVEFHFKYPVYTGEQSTIHPGDKALEPVTVKEPLPEESVTAGEPLPEKSVTAGEPLPEESVTVGEPLPEELVTVGEALPEEHEERKETVDLQQLPPGQESHGHDEGHSQGHENLSDNGHDGSYDNNGTDVAIGQTRSGSHNKGLSNIAKIGIAMGCVVLIWLLLCPIVCILCRRRDRKREKRAEEFKLKNGVPHHQHPLVDELVLTELGRSERQYSNGKQKLYGNDVQNAEELQPMKNGAHHSNGDAVATKPNGNAPLASQEALDTEV